MGLTAENYKERIKLGCNLAVTMHTLYELYYNDQIAPLRLALKSKKIRHQLEQDAKCVLTRLGLSYEN